jgi:RimJ/RimL family protein N-acetyltransferase
VDELVGRVRGLWGEVAGATLPADGVRVVHAEGSRICPPGWVGSVTIEGATLVVAPTAAVAEQVGAVGVEGLARVDELGPAALAYLDASPPLVPVEWLPAEARDLRDLYEAVEPAELDESGLEGLPVAVLRDGRGVVVAAAGWHPWPASTSHIGVLAAERVRGRGLATVVAGAVSGEALRAGLLPQWRARVPASIRVAAKLGYRTLGHQRSVKPRTA